MPTLSRTFPAEPDRPRLIPTPRALEISPDGPALATPTLVSQAQTLWKHLCSAPSAPPALQDILIDRRDDLGHPERYLLEVRTNEANQAQIRIIASVSSLRHAAATLLQLLTQYPAHIPQLRIDDQPAFAVRGVMLDVSRDRVPTMEHLEAFIHQMALLKLNHLQLYTEHTFAYRDHQIVWQDADPLTCEQVRRLDRLCAQLGIDLAPNQNCFGHLRNWLKHERYAHLAEIAPDGLWKFMHWERRGPFSLSPTNPGSLPFIQSLLQELLPNFSSRLVNIGCDETFDIGFGNSKPVVEARAFELARTTALSPQQAAEIARAELFFSFAGNVCNIALEMGKIPMMWADIALHHPDMLDKLPHQAVGLVWGYEPNDDFAAGVKAWQGNLSSRYAWVCPGTSSWRSIIGRSTESRLNILNAARQGLQHNAAGLLVCDWGDVGHMQQWPITLMGICRAAHHAWSGADATADLEAASLHVFADKSRTIADWLDALGDADLPLRQESHANYSPDPSSVGIKNASALFTDLFPPVPIPPRTDTVTGKTAPQRAVEAPLELWLSCRDQLEELQQSQPRLADVLLSRELAHTLAFAIFAADHAIAQRDNSIHNAEMRQHLTNRAIALLDAHRSLWLLRSRPGGLTDSCSHLQKIIDTLTRATVSRAD